MGTELFVTRRVNFEAPEGMHCKGCRVEAINFCENGEIDVLVRLTVESSSTNDVFYYDQSRTINTPEGFEC